MPSCVRNLALLALGLGMASVSNAKVGDSGSGSTTRYWDCCKGSCSWPDKAPVDSPVKTCSKNDSPLSDANAASGCDGGTAYMCSDQSPWAESADLAYGFAAVSIPGGDESSWCCSCYELTFTSTSIAGKKMIVQATNTGGDLAEGQFDLAIPGGGVGLFNACTDQYGAPDSGWGAQYGGISTDTCSTFPQALKQGCSFRFGDFFEGADNPTVDWKQVACPAALTEKTGCKRSDEGAGENYNSGSGSGAASSKPAAQSSKTSAAAQQPSSDSSVYEAATSSAAESSEAAPVETQPSGGDNGLPPSYGTTTQAGVSYSSAAASSEAGAVGGSSSSSAAASSGVLPPPPYGAGSSSGYAQPTGGAGGDDGQCHIEYVYVDGGNI